MIQRQILHWLAVVAAVWATCESLSAQPPAVDRYVLLKSGRVMAGQVQQDAQGYLVTGRNGRLHAPYEHVQLVADSLHDIYRQQRDARKEPVTPESRIELARWCISYSLYDEARLELKFVLRSDANHVEARQMLKKLAEVLKPDRLEEPPPPSRTLDGYLVPEAESLGSLSRETAATFTARVQPILVNKCGNARCHGVVSENSFRLVHVRSNLNSHRLHTERNLAAVSPYLDLQRPGESQLLTVPQGNHGGGSVAIFGGPGGERQLEIIREWVYAAARDRGGYDAEAEALAAAARSAVKEKADVAAAAPDAAAAARTDAGADGLAATNDGVPGSRPQSTDPFDPEVFNALVHGGALPQIR